MALLQLTSVIPCLQPHTQILVDQLQTSTTRFGQSCVDFLIAMFEVMMKHNDVCVK
jgi:hypothetical protein